MKVERTETLLAGFAPSTVPQSTPAVPAPAATDLVAHSGHSPDRLAAERYVQAQYLQHFDARVKHFMPTLLTAYEDDGSIRAVVGVRNAADERLFLETYTRMPVEQLMQRRLGVDIRREHIAEVGSLACRSGRAAMQIVLEMVPWLIGAGFSWVVFTGADTVLNVFRRLRLEPQPLCRADKALLGAAADDWGSYYDHHPVVMAGRIVEGLDAVELMPRVR